jgi:hypothetical protein
LDKHGNPNVLTMDRGTSRLAQGSSAQTALVEIELFRGELAPISAFEPPIKDQAQGPLTTWLYPGFTNCAKFGPRVPRLTPNYYLMRFSIDSAYSVKCV